MLAAIVPGQEPEAHDAGVSRSGENGSHLEATDVAEGHAGQVERSGSSGNAETGSHLEAADVAEGHAGQLDGPGSSRNAGTGSHLVETDIGDEPGRFCDGGPGHAVQKQASCRTGRPRWTVRYRKRPCGVREAHLSAVAARGSGSSAGRHVERVV